jgi:hypothetical protein
MRGLAWLVVPLAACAGEGPLAPRGGDTAPADAAGGDPGDAAPVGDPVPAGDPVPQITWTTVRAIFHAHSIYSHDGCTGDGYPLGSPESLACQAQLRAAPCALGIDLVSLTDHPAHMQDQPFVDDLLFDAGAGDVLVTDGSDAVANRVTCANGHRYLFTAGYESQHSMPLGLHHHLPAAEDYDGITDATPIGTVQARVAAMSAAGAVPAVVHSEMDDISAATIRDGGFAAMEWYNIHANIMALTGGEEYLITGDYQTVIDSLSAIDDFLLGSSAGAHPDLVYLALLPFLPPQGFAKWTEVTAARPITGILGTDVHRNLAVDAGVCEGDILEPLCLVAAALYPNVLTLLLSGGTIQLTDNEQIDSYRRLMSWLENRILVAGEVTPLTIALALRQGQSFGLFTVFGEPDAFSFSAVDAGGRRHAMGAALSGPATLHVEVPTRPVALPGTVPFSGAEAELAELRAALVFTDGSGRREVAAGTASFDHLATAVGAYHVEISIRPLHLAPHLGSEAALADPVQLWLITNPIRIAP